MLLEAAITRVPNKAPPRIAVFKERGMGDVAEKDYSIPSPNRVEEVKRAMEQWCCDLEVDVDGQETFFIDKKLLSFFSGKISNVFANLSLGTERAKVIFLEFPGGANGFELFTRCCYQNGKIEMSPSNVILLHYASMYMEMKSNGSDMKNQLEESVASMNCWTSSEIFDGLKQCQDLGHCSGSVCLILRLLDSFVERLSSSGVSGSFSSSSDSSVFRTSCDTRSTVASSLLRTTWWFEHLLFLKLDLIEKLVKTLVSHKFDQGITSRFIFYYHQKSASTRVVDAAEKGKFVEATVSLLHLLDKNSIYRKGLFDIFQVALRLKISKSCKSKLEFLVGSQLDQAALDDLLVSSSKDCVYDVSLVLRLLKIFLVGCSSAGKLRKVAYLIDSYAMEVAPDLSLKPCKFTKFVLALPDNARDCHDALYLAIDMYLQIHGGLSEEEKMKLCQAVNCKKLSSQALKHMAQNAKFPSKEALDYQHLQPERLIMYTRKDNEKSGSFKKSTRTRAKRSTKFLPKLCSCDPMLF